MPTETLLLLFAIAAGTVWTPGPNNAMLASSAVGFGFRRTVPHLFGVALGFPMMVFAVGFGLGEVFRQYPLIGEVLRWIGAALLLWFAWRTFNAPPPGEGGSGRRPFTFVEAAAFQWVNPKAWIMAISVISQFVTGQALVLEAAICAGVYAVCGLTSASGWAGFGAALKRFLSTPSRLQMFNAVMALLIVASIAMLLRSDLSL